ncbi:hypothetical protein IE81DRAFT_219083 [Ceraceosorus guamensis]|uniref:Cation/H+ exchanger transmembrane domain-containing protein n=1 Tax=Ceraceosorus guamensis TaxID=1522189 RepID=A0A316VTE5_9BASI|nr:hypothetical protein IE81DRAFT_219083 [Ceraceosorus guamensis]PWN40494.1 hypothetical protein IE81DRAFT_219083 [Ceraceosorus guamensis]
MVSEMTDMASEAIANVEPGSFRPFEVTAVHIIYTALGGFIVIFGMLSLFIKERLYMGEAPLAALFGIIIGPVAATIFDPTAWGGNHMGTPGGHVTNEVTLEVLRVTLALSVFAIGVELPKKYLLRHWRSVFILLGPVMIWGWMITGLLIWGLIPGLDFLNSLVVAAAVTPTDPILAQAVIGGPWAEQHVPAHIRHILLCESGCNDGAAFPFLFLSIFLTTHRDNTGRAIALWFYDALGYQIILGTLLGALIGFLARKFMRFSERHKLIDRESFVAQYISLAVLSMGVGVLLGSDDLLGAFACGTAFAWDGWFTRQTEESNFSNIVDLLFNVASFVYIGALMPFHSWVNAEIGLTLGRLFPLSILTLLLKRIPPILILWKWIPDIKSFREALFAAHFGPIGAGALFISTLARTELPEEVNYPPENGIDHLAATCQSIVLFFILSSIIVHGLSIPFFNFSRHATTITRTWSRHASMRLTQTQEGGEPGWLHRVRRFKTGDTLKHEEGQMSEIERVLNAQLGVIGRGAIGGDAEKELRKEDTQNGTSNSAEGSGSGADESSSSGGERGPSTPFVGLLNKRTEKDLEKADEEDVDDPEDYDGGYTHDPSSEWGGENCIEMRRYREKRAREREERRVRERANEQRKSGDRDDARRAEQRDAEDGDIGEAPMDRELHQGQVPQPLADDVREEQGRSGVSGAHDAQGAGSGSTYPCMRSWVEGHKLLLEYQKSRSSEPEVHILELTDADREALHESEAPAHTWVRHHAEGIEQHLGITEHHEWTPKQAVANIIHHGIVDKYNNHIRSTRNNAQGGQATSQKRTTSASPHSDDGRFERDERAALIYGGLSAASGLRNRRGDSKSPTAGARRDSSAQGSDEGNSSSSKSPTRSSSKAEKVSKPMVHSTRPAGATAGRRLSLRKRLLAGHINFQGRRGGQDDEGLEAHEEVISEDSAFSAPASAQTSAPRPTSIFMGQSDGGGRSGAGFPRTDSLPSTPRSATRFLPRTASAGGLADDSYQKGTVQWVDVADKKHEHVPGLHPAPRGKATSVAGKPSSRSASPHGATPTEAERYSKHFERTRTVSNASQAEARDVLGSTAIEGEPSSSGGGTGSGHARRSKGRIGSLFSSLTSARHSSQNSDGEMESPRTPVSRFLARPSTLSAEPEPSFSAALPRAATTMSSETGILSSASQFDNVNTDEMDEHLKSSSTPGSASQSVMLDLPGQDDPVAPGSRDP